jgi:enoyl reductase-like protein
MRKLQELITAVRKKYPADKFFSDFENKWSKHPLMEKYFRTYNKAFMTMDLASWEILKAKALQHYLDHRRGQLKQGFFNQLNESFAYRYLIRQGFDGVRLIKEGKKPSPDIQFRVHDGLAFCEVKTLNISNDEIYRRTRINVAQDGFVYACLSDGFIKKFCDAVQTAKNQIHAVGDRGLIYVIVEFDDFAGFCYETYKKQLLELISVKHLDNIIIQIGLLGVRRICAASNLRLHSDAPKGGA